MVTTPDEIKAYYKRMTAWRINYLRRGVVSVEAPVDSTVDTMYLSLQHKCMVQEVELREDAELIANPGMPDSVLGEFPAVLVVEVTAENSEWVQVKLPEMQTDIRGWIPRFAVIKR